MPYGRITPKQQEILDYIKNEILNRGFPPAVREICEAVNLKSTSSVHSHLEALEKNGYIRRDATKHIPVLPYVKKVYARQIHQVILLIMQGRAVRSMLPERCTDLVIQKQLLLRHLLPRKNFQRYGLI